MPNVQDMACCDCVGLCNDVSICKCINEQRNYTFQNCLISGICKPIFECNIKCSCNRLRCSNRVVEQGIYMLCRVCMYLLYAGSTCCMSDFIYSYVYVYYVYMYLLYIYCVQVCSMYVQYLHVLSTYILNIYTRYKYYY